MSLILPPGVDRLWPGQPEAVQAALDAYERGISMVVLDAPPGSGKTVIAETIRENLKVNGLYLCTTRALQDQFAASFPYCGVIKGRSNYVPMDGPAGITCDDCTRGEDIFCLTNPTTCEPEENHCSWCHPSFACPYTQAKYTASRKPVVCTNTAYAMGELKGRATLGGRGLGVVDECDVLESSLVDGTAAEVPVSLISRAFRLRPSEDVDWVRHKLIPTLQGAADDQDTTSIEGLRRKRRFENHVERLEKALMSPGTIWQLSDTHLTAKPLSVDPRAASEALWGHAQRWLLMSGTVISPKTLLEGVGWEQDYESVVMPCQYPVDNRPVVFRPVVDMKRATYDAAKMATGIARVILSHPEERILVHTFNKKLAFELREFLRSLPLVRSYDYGGRDEALAWFRATPGAVLLAYSLDRGISLDDDQCRVQVIAKYPHPFLGDRRVKAKSDSAWYAVEGIRTMVQMTGRIVRSPTDYGITYILDTGFATVYRRHDYLFPRWWRDGLRVER